MIVSQEAYMETDVVYIVSVRSLRCGQNFYNDQHPERGILLKEFTDSIFDSTLLSKTMLSWV